MLETLLPLSSREKQAQTQHYCLVKSEYHRDESSWLSRARIEMVGATWLCKNTHDGNQHSHVGNWTFLAPNMLDLGNIIIGTSFLFFLVASYAVFFSAFIPKSGILVRPWFLWFLIETLQFCLDSKCSRWRYALQILHNPHYPHRSLFCYCKLGGMAILSQLVNQE